MSWARGERKILLLRKQARAIAAVRTFKSYADFNRVVPKEYLFAPSTFTKYRDYRDMLEDMENQDLDEDSLPSLEGRCYTSLASTRNSWLGCPTLT